MCCGASLGPNLDLLGGVVENADTDVVELEILLNIAHDFSQHLLRIFAGDGGFRNIVQKGELPGPALFLRKQARVFDCNRNLSGGSLQHFQIALFEHILMTGTHRRNDACRSAIHQDGSSAERLRRIKVRANEQRLPGAQNVFGKSVIGFALSAWKWTVLLDFEMKRDRIAYLECDIEIRGVKYLP